MITYDVDTKTYKALSTDDLSSIAVPNAKVYYTDNFNWQTYDKNTSSWVDYYAFKLSAGGGSSGTVKTVSSSNVDIGVIGATDITLTLNSGTGANQIVKFDGNSKYPSNDGSQITGLTKLQVGLSNVANSDTTNASNIITGTLADTRLSTNVTLQGNTFNGNNQLIKLNSNAEIPAISGKNLTGMTSSQVGLNNVQNIDTTIASNITSGTLSSSRLPIANTNLGAIKTGNSNISVDSNGLISANIDSHSIDNNSSNALELVGYSSASTDTVIIKNGTNNLAYIPISKNSSNTYTHIASKEYVDEVSTGSMVLQGTKYDASTNTPNISNISAGSNALAWVVGVAGTQTLGGKSFTFSLNDWVVKTTSGDYLQLTTGSSGSVWGSIGGTLSNQTDLTNALSLKMSTVSTAVNSDVAVFNASGSVIDSKVKLTQPTNNATITIKDGKTFTCDNSVELAGLDGGIYTLPSANSTLLANNLGVTGGTTLIGDTASGGNLTLKSTSNATQGSVILASNTTPSVNNTFDLGSSTAVYKNLYARNITSDNVLSISSNATNNLTINSGTTGSVTVDSGTTGNVNIGNNANAKTITIGNNTGATAINVTSGTGGLNVSSNGVIAVNNASGQAINIGTTGGNNTITVGNTTTGTNIVLNTPSATGTITATGKIKAMAANATNASFNLPSTTTTPSSPSDGDMYRNQYNELLVVNGTTENRLITENVVNISSQVTQTINPCTMVDLANSSAAGSVLTLASGTRTGQKISFLVSATFNGTSYITINGNINGVAGNSIMIDKGYTSFYLLWSQTNSTYVLCTTGSGF